MGETNKTAPTNKRNGEQQRKEGAIKSLFLFRTNGGKAKEGSVKDAGETRAKTFFLFFLTPRVKSADRLVLSAPTSRGSDNDVLCVDRLHMPVFPF